MTKTPAIVLLLSLAASTAQAADPALSITNMSGEAITALTAAPKGSPEAASQNLLTAGIAAGATASVTIPAPDDTCVFDLAFTFASGQTTRHPDTDICQSDGIVVE